jgi:hypothetical protein
MAKYFFTRPFHSHQRCPAIIRLALGAGIRLRSEEDTNISGTCDIQKLVAVWWSGLSFSHARVLLPLAGAGHEAEPAR